MNESKQPDPGSVGEGEAEPSLEVRGFFRRRPCRRHPRVVRHIRHERRVRRSDDPIEALQLWLQAEARRVGARAMSVSTPQGIPLAQFGLEDPDRLALAASLASRGARMAAREELSDVDGYSIRLEDGLEVVLGTCGTFVPAEGERHVRRILS